jgi:hypothetical protein
MRRQRDNRAFITNTPNGTYEIFYDGGSFPGVSVENNAAEITAVQGIYNNIYHTVGGCSSIDLPDAVVSDPEKPTLELLSHTDQTECNGKGRLELHITGLSSGQLFTIYHDDGQFPILGFMKIMAPLIRQLIRVNTITCIL